LEHNFDNFRVKYGLIGGSNRRHGRCRLCKPRYHWGPKTSAHNVSQQYW